ncbi:MAG: MerR family transcriptional regulator [Actinobacteria bacterium]|nr:MerR family transcriptional regulator [Actinomycetota bacterium]
MAEPPAHLSIGEVLNLLQGDFPDITISKIRFLESQGLIDPERTPSGYRKFYEPDIERLRWILTQQKDHFLPLKVIKERLLEAGQGAAPDGGGNGDRGDRGDRGAGRADAEANATRRGAEQPEVLFESEGTGGSQPVWMADAARARAGRATGTRLNGPRGEASPGRGGTDAAADGAGGIGGSPLDRGPTTVSLTLEELASAAGLEVGDVRALEQFGLVVGRTVGPDLFYDGDALVIAQKAAGFLRHGIEPRHLRMFKTTADREASFLEQVVLPVLKQRSPEARRQALATLGELAALGQAMRAALLRSALRDHLA